MIGGKVLRDERTLAIENASYRWGYTVLAYGVLLSAGYRGLVRGEAGWDLLGLVIASGLVTAGYQGRRGVLTRQSVGIALAAFLLAAMVAAALAYLL